MFRVHRLSSNSLSVRNLVLLFFTIVLGFASVITLAQISIPSTIDNAWQTIGRVTVTSDGTDSGNRLRDFNYDNNGKTFIEYSVLSEEQNYAGKVLGMNEKGDLIYVYSQNLVVSGVSAGGGGGSDIYWTGSANDIWNINAGDIGIGSSTMSGKLHITSSAQTELYVEETTANNAANINLKNTVNNWMLGGFSDRFYIGNNGVAFFNVMVGGNVGIGTINPKVDLQVVGTFIAGDYSNTTTGIDSSIAGGSGNILTGNYSFIGAGKNNKINNSIIDAGDVHPGYSSIIGGENNIITGTVLNHSLIGGGKDNQIITSNFSIIGGGMSGNITQANDAFIGGGFGNNIYIAAYSSIGGGQNNSILGLAGSFGTWSFIGGGKNNQIISNYSNIGGGSQNTITGGTNNSIVGGQSGQIINSNYSFIGGGQNNGISGADNSIVAGVKSINIGHDNAFVRNSDDDTYFGAGRDRSFLINVPYNIRALIGGVYKAIGGVGINTNNPQALLDVNGDSIIRGDIIVTGDIRIMQQINTITDGTACSAAGTIAYDGTGFYGCKGDNIRKKLDN